MIAFHGDPVVKARYIARVEAHRAADELTRGTGWENGRGCAVGCTLDSYERCTRRERSASPPAFRDVLIGMAQRPVENLSRKQRNATPHQFADLLVTTASTARGRAR